MQQCVSVAISAVAVFGLSSVYYVTMTSVEVQRLDPAAADRGGQPAATKRIRGLAQRASRRGDRRRGPSPAPPQRRFDGPVGPGAVTGFPLVWLTGPMMWEKVPTVPALLHAGDWLRKLRVISAVVGLCR